MQSLHPDLFVTEGSLRFLGLPLDSRMTAVRLGGDDWLLHSPIAPTPALVEEVKALGTVRCLVAPNRFHHLFVGDWQAGFPEAETWVAPGLPQKRPDLKITGVLGELPEAAWDGVLEQCLLGGIPAINEIVFFHPASATLLATDLAFNIGPDHAPLTRFAFRALGSYGSLKPSVVERLLARDRATLRASVERILAWPFERVIVAHGRVVEQGGRAELEAGYGWLLR